MGIYFTIHAASLPDTTIKHKDVSYFSSEQRLVLDALLQDNNKISTARCYFKTKLDDNYLYVPMNHLDGNKYQCIIPALSDESQVLEYFFLIVNSNGQVTRSTPYISTEAGSNVLLEGQAMDDDSSMLYVYSELEKIEKKDTAIVDDQINLLVTKGPDQLFGLRAGIYEQKSIPDYLNTMPGYFGGFIINRTDSTIRPTKGFAPNLKIPNYLSPPLQDSRLKSNTAPLKASVKAEPPDIAGNNWSGYYKITGESYKEYLAASIEQHVFSILLITTKSGLGHYFTGSINTAGDIYLRDMWDGEIWTTHFGPATSTEMQIYDYVELPSAENPDPPFYKISIMRPPSAPSGISASDGTLRDKVTVNWNVSSGSTMYEVYSCSSDVTDSCSLLATSLTESYDDTRESKDKTYYRVKACSDYGCSEYSEYDIGYQQPLNIISFLHPILLK